MTQQEILSLVWKKNVHDQDKIRKAEQEKNYYYYIGSKNELEGYLTNALSLTYSIDDITDMQLNYVNLTKKLVNQLTVIYKEKPDRYLVDAAGKKVEKQTEYYLSILPEDINLQDKTAHRYGKVFGTSLTQVYFKNGKIRYRVHASQNLDIKTDDEDTKELELVAYEKYYKDEIFTIIYTADEYFKVDANGNPQKDKENPKNQNPIGMLPFARFFTEQGEGFWGEGVTDVVNTNEQINFLLTKLINRDLIIGSEGTVLATNCGLRKKGLKPDDEDGVKKIKIGIKNPIVVETDRTDIPAPNIQHISFQPQILEIRNTIDWYIKLIALSRGLNPNSFLADVQATSGYSKIIDSLEQLEFRQEDLENARIFEQERFEITRAVNNYYAGTQEGRDAKLQMIPEDLTLVCDFAEIEVQKTPQEIRDDRLFAWENNLSTPAHALMEDNTDLDLETAQQQIEKNKLINDELKRKTTLFESVIQKEQNGQIAKQ
ncbi:MAG: hypothetical protein WC974_09080 [Thermoplasmata archaeon]